MVKTPIMIENEIIIIVKHMFLIEGIGFNPQRSKTRCTKSKFLETRMGKNRLGFAQWIVDRENSLTSRTVVNEFGIRFFEGIVSTIEDMGTV